MNDLDGRIPSTSTALQKELPGVGKYTAGILRILTTFFAATQILKYSTRLILKRNYKHCQKLFVYYVFNFVDQEKQTMKITMKLKKLISSENVDYLQRINNSMQWK